VITIEAWITRNELKILFFESKNKITEKQTIKNIYENLENLRGVPLAIYLATQLIRDQYCIYP
jgi:hypothetical protein